MDSLTYNFFLNHSVDSKSSAFSFKPLTYLVMVSPIIETAQYKEDFDFRRKQIFSFTLYSVPLLHLR